MLFNLVKDVDDVAGRKRTQEMLYKCDDSHDHWLNDAGQNQQCLLIRVETSRQAARPIRGKTRTIMSHQVSEMDKKHLPHNILAED